MADSFSPLQAHWMALRWRVVGCLLVMELIIIGQNLLGRFFSAAVQSA